IEHIVGQPIAIEGSTVSVGISIGAVVLDGSTLDADAALQRADQFMYAVKQTRIERRLQGSTGQLLTSEREVLGVGDADPLLG
ncbi:MAG: diguanylate cyclase, partial [Actinomycetota bacterium]